MPRIPFREDAGKLRRLTWKTEIWGSPDAFWNKARLKSLITRFTSPGHNTIGTVMSTTAITAPHTPYLTIDEVSELTRMSRPQLAQLRYRGVGPQFIRPAGTKGLMSVLLTRVSSRRECDATYINNFKLDRCKSAQSTLPALTVILPFNPGNDR